ncbi:riboflavin deaminase [Microvirga tunisiensis]|uniref:Riboflavin deaminase n=2 Tax=Pannonibacter tanglangensis TaxID=2750084 RepID=A0A7X5J6S4_9HYPH|nr:MULTISPECIES: RibD family protein [unclassified Pannonibacter]NBN63148.1 riboflavin deaminase [Pannonibacter sp. XCT-34]NBN76712.1 riboflavin deaminase [Pannonibacter sp. XCT-53]
MQRIQISDTTWNRLLALRQGDRAIASAEAGYRLYAPIAGAREPFVLAQVGQSLDGRVATPSGDARDVSGRDGLVHLHRCRALVDAVLVGIGTVKADNPRLSVRMVSGPQPVRVVIDSRGLLDGSEGLFHDGGAPVLVFRSAGIAGRPLPAAEVIALKPQDGGLAPADILAALQDRGLGRVLVEGGARTIARFLEARLIDRLHVAISPIIIGSGPAGIRLSPIDQLACAHRPVTEVYDLGSDILFDCRLERDFGALRASGRQGQQVRVANQG